MNKLIKKKKRLKTKIKKIRRNNADIICPQIISNR
jgi:hypothetical protein